VQDDVNQEESEQDEVDGTNQGADSTSKRGLSVVPTISLLLILSFIAVNILVIVL